MSVNFARAERAIESSAKYLPASAVIAKKRILILRASLFWSRVLIESKRSQVESRSR
jgi:hypothetical protein